MRGEGNRKAPQAGNPGPAGSFRQRCARPHFSEYGHDLDNVSAALAFFFSP